MDKKAMDKQELKLTVLIKLDNVVKDLQFAEQMIKDLRSNIDAGVHINAMVQSELHQSEAKRIADRFSEVCGLISELQDEPQNEPQDEPQDDDVREFKGWDVLEKLSQDYFEDDANDDVAIEVIYNMEEDRVDCYVHVSHEAPVPLSDEEIQLGYVRESLDSANGEGGFEWCEEKYNDFVSEYL